MSQRTGSVGIFAISLALMVYHTDAADSVTLSELVCDSEIYDLGVGDSMTVKWDGTELPDYCRLGFEAPDSSSSTCFNIEKFRLYNCGFYIEIYKNYDAYPTKTYDCSATDIDEEYCVSSDKITFLKFTYNYTGFASFSPKVRLSVTIQAEEAVASSEASSILQYIFGAGVIIVFITIATIRKREKLEKCKELLNCIACLPCALCNLMFTACCRLKNRCRDSVTSLDIDCRQALDCCQPRFQEPNVIDAGTVTVCSQTESGNNVADFDDITTEESAHPSAAPTDNGWAPPPYVAPPPDESTPEAPPPSYYDVVTGNVSVSNA